jgi:hypothetical protein
VGRVPSSKVPPIWVPPPPLKPNDPFMRGEITQKIAPTSARTARAGQRPVASDAITMPTQIKAITSVLSGGHES